MRGVLLHFLLLCLLVTTPAWADDHRPAWERAFDEGAHVRKIGRPVLLEPAKRDLKDPEKRLLGQWRQQSDDWVRDCYYGPVDEKTGRGEYYATTSDAKARNEVALIYSVNLEKSDDQKSIVRYYADRDSPVPVFREWVDQPKHGRHIVKRVFRELDKRQTYDYVGANAKPASKAPRGYIVKPVLPGKADGLRRELLEAAQRLTKANRSLRIINQDYLEARWRPKERTRHARRLERFVEGELKRSRNGFKTACRRYTKAYGRRQTKAMLEQHAFGDLFKRDQ